MEPSNVDILEGDWLDMINEESSSSHDDFLAAKSGHIAPAGFTRQHSLELSPPSKRKKFSPGLESPSVVPIAVTTSTSSAVKREAAHPLSNFTETGISQMSPDELAVVVAAKATQELRSKGLAFMEHESSTLNTLEDFRQAFNGANGSTFDSDDEFGGEQSGEGADGTKKKRLRPVNPDAELIERATEEQVRILNIDCRGTEGKKQRRRIRNRMSAQLHRERKKLYIDALEAFVKIKEGRITSLERDVMHLAKENEYLRGVHGVKPVSVVVSGSSEGACGSRAREAVDANMRPSDISTGGTDDSGSELTNSPAHHSSHDGEIDTDPAVGACTTSSDDTVVPSVDGMSDEEKSILSALLHEEGGDMHGTQQETVIHGNQRGGSGTGVRLNVAMAPLLPLLSVICLLCVTMYGNGIGQVTFPRSKDAIHRRLTAAGFPEQDSASTESDPSLAMVSVATLKEEQADLVQQWQALLLREREVERHEADLLALPAPPASTTAADASATASSFSGVAPDLYSLLHGYYPEGPYEHVERSLHKGLILWRRDKLLNRIYPRHFDEVAGMGVGVGVGATVSPRGAASGERNVTITSRRTNVKAGNLRRRPVAPSVTQQDTATATEPSATNALIPSQAATKHMEELAFPRPRSVSRVLLKQGSVLLDPQLAMPIVASAAGASSPTDETHSPSDVSTRSLSTAVGIHSPPKEQIPSQAHSHSRARATDVPGALRGGGGSEENVVMIAVPASSVRWGDSWISSVPNSLYNASAPGEGGQFDGDDAYIELGCSVFKAQVVSAVQTHEHTSR